LLVVAVALTAVAVLAVIEHLLLVNLRAVAHPLNPQLQPQRVLLTR
jgi:hypothetical protein